MSYTLYNVIYSLDERSYRRPRRIAEQPYRGQRLLQGVSVAADLKDHRAGGEVLVVAILCQRYRPHEAGVGLAYRVLQIESKAQILPPVRVLESARVAPDEKHHLTCAHALLGGGGLVRHRIRAQRVPVQINDDLYTRVVCQIFFDSLAAAVI